MRTRSAGARRTDTPCFRRVPGAPVVQPCAAASRRGRQGDGAGPARCGYCTTCGWSRLVERADPAPGTALRRFGREDDRIDRGEALGSNRVIAPVAVTAAGFPFFLDVCDLAARRHLAVAADHAAARERREAEKPNQTHHRLRFEFSNMCAHAPRSRNVLGTE